MAKTSQAAKKQPKVRRRLKKQVRKTLGALFLASALAVAAIPVDNLQAAGIPEADKITVNSSISKIPTVTAADKIYATGDGTYLFAYIRAEGSTNKVAVILKYQPAGQLEGNSLVIPDEIDQVYKKYLDNNGTNRGYVAVGESGNSLYYKTQEIIIPAQNIYDVDGITVIGQTDPVMADRYYPCYYENVDEWEDISAQDFFYIEDDSFSVSAGDASQFTQVQGNVDYMPITDITVAYIGNQYLNAAGTQVEGTVNASNQKGVFANNNNIVNLQIGPNLRGIGDYAFYGCASLGDGNQTVTLGNGLSTIGNYAFANCLNMEKINLDKYSNLEVIGDHAFYNCQALVNFQMPIAVTKVGDSAFENCYALENIILDGNYPDARANVAINDLGVSVFKECRSLESISLPETYSTSEDISLIQGCTSLQYVRIPNQTVEFTTDYEIINWDNFKSTVPAEFYFAAKDASKIHDITREQAIAFRYIDINGNDLDKFEIVMEDDQGRQATYQVNSSNQLISAVIDEGIESVEIPPTIGPYKITEINGSSFQGNCSIKKLVIPPSILSIADAAFKGCHNLESVIFTEPVNLSSIGSEAFKTQDVVVHDTNCLDTDLSDNTPVLKFTGPISPDSVPFKYAMNASNNINEGAQPVTYIQYFSGWPSNLEAKYNPATGKSELVDYPTYADLKNPAVYTKANYPYLTDANLSAITDLIGNVDSQNANELKNEVLNITIPDGINAFKANLFKNNEEAEISEGYGNSRKTIKANAFDAIPANSFEGCATLTAIEIGGNTTSIGDYAFLDCVNLATATISASVEELGKRPFAGCKSLSTISFGGGPYFAYESGIIYGLTDGVKSSVVECLESRGSIVGSQGVGPEELAGITSFAEEAFMNCSNIAAVRLQQSVIELIPVKAFYGTTNLSEAIIPSTCYAINKQAFQNSKVWSVTIPGSVVTIDNDAFDTYTNMASPPSIEFVTPADSNAAKWVKGSTDHRNITIVEKADPIYYEVEFMQYEYVDGVKSAYPVRIGEKQTILSGQDAVPPNDAVTVPEGSVFNGEWSPDYRNVSSNIAPMPQFTSDEITVTFKNDDYTDIRSRSYPRNSLLDDIKPKDPEKEGYVFVDWDPLEDSMVTEDPNTQERIVTKDAIFIATYEVKEYVTVRFIDSDQVTVLDEITVPYNYNGVVSTQVVPTPPEGQKFDKFFPVIPSPLVSDWDTYAQYISIGDPPKYTVQFLDDDFVTQLLPTQLVEPGGVIIPPRDPEKPGYVFVKWLNDLVGKAINKDETSIASWAVDSDGDGKADNSGGDNSGGDNSGGDNSGGDNSGGDNSGGDNSGGDNNGGDNSGGDNSGGDNSGGDNSGDNNNGSGNTEAKYYTLTVQNGSGSGSYVEGADVIIIANDPVKGQKFDKWTINPSTTKLASILVTATVVKMPASEVTVTAHYVSDGTSSSNTSSSNTGGGSSNNNNSSGSSSGNSGGTSSGTITGGTNSDGGGTTVIISKNGLSNTGVVSAVVNGSSDDFVIRLSDNNAATEDVLRALINEFGSLDNIIYFPMDITLYDSTGNTEITDTTGLSIDITLPIPDSMITYAGNNKVASVVNQKLEKLNARFSTISGVACVTFRATHFSPYVIYVDTSNLTAGTISDNTPKTGDGMHPKWFLALGLACMSVIFFMKKERVPRRRLA
jgi:hypothetical protein